MQPGRLKWPLWSVFIGKISATSQQNIIVEIHGKVKYSSCSSGYTALPCVWCFQVVIGVLKLLGQQDLIYPVCLTISWNGGIFLCSGGSSSCIYYRNNMTLKYQPVAIVLFWDCSTGVRKAEGFGFMETGCVFSIQVLFICSLLPVFAYLLIIICKSLRYLKFERVEWCSLLVLLS